MKRTKETNLYQFLKGYDLTVEAADYVKELMNFKLDLQIPQRKLVKLGKAIGRTVSMEYVLQLAHKGFRKDLIEGGLAMLQEEISKLMAGFWFKNKTVVVEGYQEDGDWFQLV